MTEGELEQLLKDHKDRYNIAVNKAAEVSRDLGNNSTIKLMSKKLEMLKANISKETSPNKRISLLKELTDLSNNI